MLAFAISLICPFNPNHSVSQVHCDEADRREFVQVNVHADFSNFPLKNLIAHVTMVSGNGKYLRLKCSLPGLPLDKDGIVGSSAKRKFLSAASTDKLLTIELRGPQIERQIIARHCLEHRETLVPAGACIPPTFNVTVTRIKPLFQNPPCPTRKV